jgi:hypothetical protein
MMAMACAPEEREHMERVKDVVCAKPIMGVPTEPIEVRDMRYEFNLPPAPLCEHLSGTYKAEAAITIAPQHRKAFAEMLDGIKQSREAPPVKPRSKRGQRRKRWR